MKLRLIATALLLNLLSALPVPAQDLEAVFTKGERLTYNGYDVTRSFDRETSETSATIRRGRRVLASFRGGSGEDSTRFGLFSFLGGESRQLLIEQYSGGAHCCLQYWIYELSPRLRPLFDGGRYSTGSVGNQLNPLDIDGDGVYELTLSVMSFDYFDRLAHANSPFPTVVFKYDRRARWYVPANRLFSTYLLRDVGKDIREAEEVNARTDPSDPDTAGEYLAPVLQVVLDYVYAGKEQQAWDFYDRTYKLRDKSQMRAKIKRVLRTDKIYQSIYR
jgi:hypothetical protein